MSGMPGNARAYSSVQGTLSLRISDIPSTIDVHDLRRILDGLSVSRNRDTSQDTSQESPGVQEGINSSKQTRIRLSNIRRIVLAPSPSSLLSSRYQVAVVSFRFIPAELESLATDSETHDVHLTVYDGSDEFQITFDKHFHGLTPLNNSPTPSIDIVAVTGLAGHAFGSWKGRRTSDMWLQDFLPDDLQHQGYHTRVLTYGYDTKLVESTSTATMHDISKQFLHALRCARGQAMESRRPLIFIGHSLGGLVIKQALSQAESNISDTKNRDCLKSCNAIMFFGVPNKGLQASQLTSMVKGQPNDHLVRDLVGESQYLQLLDQVCSKLFKDEQTRVISFYEERQTPTVIKNNVTGKWERKGDSILMVTRESAVHSVTNKTNDSIPLDADHSNIVKFSSRSDKKYEVVLEKISETVKAAQKIVKDRSVKRRSQKKSEKRIILEWLAGLSKNLEFSETYRGHISKRFKDTGSWFLAEDRFQHWKSSPESNLLWCHGMPGTGKTVLLSLVLQKLEEEFRPQSNTGILFAYCDYTTDIDPLTYLAVFLKQLCRHLDYAPSMLKKLHQKHTSNLTKPTLNELQEVFIAVSGHFNRVFLLFDAFDECSADTRKDLIPFFKGIVSSDHIKLFITSRKNPDIEFGFQDFPKIEVEARRVAADIKAYATAELETINVRDSSLKEKILQTILDKSGAMFLWVYFQLKHIRDQVSDDGIERALKTLPEDMDQTYERIIRLINNKPKEHRKLARRVLMWIAYAERPLELEELVCAVAMENDTKDDAQLCRSMVTERKTLADVCANLVVLGSHPYRPTIRFVHFSVQEYLLQKSLGSDKLSPVGALNIDRESSHTEMARLCIIFMLYCNIRAEESLYHYYNFIRYATWAWSRHVRAITRVSEELVEIILKFLKFGVFLGPTGVMSRFDRHNVFRRQDRNFSPLVVALVFELPLVYKQLETRQNELQSYPEDVYAMHYAAREGSCSAIEGLCGQSFSVDQPDGSDCAPLYYASSKQVAQILLDNGADVNRQGGTYGNVLQAAVFNRRFDLVELLLNRGANVDAQGGLYGNALQAAAFKGTVELVQLLLDKGADVDAQGGFYGNALQAALYASRTEHVKLLLERKADVNAQGGFCGNALQTATMKNNIDLVQLLIDRKAHINAKGGYYGNALQAAVFKGGMELVVLLLDRGADVNAQGGKYGNPLQTAAYTDRIGLVQLFLDRGADVNAQGGEWGNALQAAVRTTNIEIVQLLLDRGADVNLQGGRYGNTLQAAVSGGNIAAVPLLLNQGADVNIVGDAGNALQAAASGGNTGLAQLLLERGADVNAQGGDYGSALQAAVYSGKIDLVQLLLDAGADVDAGGGEFGGAFCTAASKSDIEMIRLLLDRGADVNQEGRQGTPLQLAVCSSISFSGSFHQAARENWDAEVQKKIEVLRFLVENGADVNVRSGKYGTALEAAVEVSVGGAVEVVKFLLDNGAAANGDFGNALKSATRHRDSEMVQLLQDRGARMLV